MTSLCEATTKVTAILLSIQCYTGRRIWRFNTMNSKTHHWPWSSVSSLLLPYLQSTAQNSILMLSSPLILNTKIKDVFPVLFTGTANCSLMHFTIQTRLGNLYHSLISNYIIFWIADYTFLGPKDQIFSSVVCIHSNTCKHGSNSSWIYGLLRALSQHPENSVWDVKCPRISQFIKNTTFLTMHTKHSDIPIVVQNMCRNRAYINQSLTGKKQERERKKKV